MNKLRYIIFVVTVFLVLALSAMNTVPALADDSTPPPTETPLAETPPTDAAAEVAPPVEEVNSIVDEITPVEETTAELLTQVPEGTELVIVNEEGETIPLVTQEAVDAITFIDPVWCPVGVVPQNGIGGCTTSFGSLRLLVDNLMAGTAGVVPATNGVIWIQAGADASSGEILLDGNDPQLGAMETFSLTLKGGWNGTFGSTVTSSLTPSTFTQSISVINWLGDITLTDITIANVTVGSASNSAALNVQTTRNITLTNVKVNNNTGAGTVNGASLDNADADPLVFGDVSITNSQFNDNKNVGLTVNSEGIITLANVLVTGNDAGGAYLSNQTATTAKAVNIVTGTNEFSNNLVGDGLNINSTGIITLNDITANSNGGSGIFIDNRFGNAVVGITFTGTTIAADNGGDGIRAYSDGAITASDLVANSNGGYGTYLDNTLAVSAQAITIPGNANQFKFNGKGGLYILSAGAVYLNSIAANQNGNGYSGLVVSNVYGTTPVDVTITGTSTFLNNGGEGASIDSKGNVTLSNITASGNSSGGLGIATTDFLKAVTLTGTNTFNNNGNVGLLIWSIGPITVSNLTASNNPNTRGAELDNFTYGSPLDPPQNVTVTGYATVNNNGASGMAIYSYGVITVNNVTANLNAGNGLFTENDFGMLPNVVSINGTNNFNGNAGSGLIVYSLGAITLNNVTSASNGSYGIFAENDYGLAVGGISLNGVSYIDSNGYDGIYFLSTGNIVLADLDSNNNGTLQVANQGYGVYLDNTSGTGTITVGTTRPGWCNSMSNNFYSGLEVYTNGSVTLFSLCNDGNGSGSGYGYGAYVDNCHELAGECIVTGAPYVNLIGDNYFSDNASDGLYISSFGQITTNNLTSSYNIGNGAYLNNQWLSNVDSSESVGAITLNGYNVFNNNGVDGLNATSHGNIVAYNLTANENGNNGVSLIVNKDQPVVFSYVTKVKVKGKYKNVIAYYIVTEANITLNGISSFIGNTNGDGLYVSADGAITLYGINANLNGGDGANLTSTTAGYGISLFNANHYTENIGTGLVVNSAGAITIYDVNASFNLGNGAELHTATNGYGINLYGTNYFTDNAGAGLSADSAGALILYNITAQSNLGNGVDLNNSASLTNLDVTLYGTNVFDNNNVGLQVLSHGIITTYNLSASGNNADGVNLDNCDDLGTGCSVTGAPYVNLIGNNYFNNNGGDGLDISSFGQIIINNLKATYNVLNGVHLNNLHFSTALVESIGNITLSGYNIFTNNQGDGLNASSSDDIVIYGLTANQNGNNGVSLTVKKDQLAVKSSVTMIKVKVKGKYVYKYVTTYYQATNANITLYGVNNFIGNANGDGLKVSADGTITITDLYAEGNGGNGVDLNNTNSGTASPQLITINGSGQFHYNGENGLAVHSYGVITTNGLTANDNGQNAGSLGYGVYLNNCDNNGPTCNAVTATNVTINGTNLFNDNFRDGLNLQSLGAITTNNITSTFNNGNGVVLNNQFGFGFFGVTLTGSNVFETNNGDGLVIASNGMVTLNNLSGNSNSGDGVQINTQNSISEAKINITGNNYFSGNSGTGLVILADASISLNNVTANGNSGNGASINNFDAQGSHWDNAILNLTGINSFSNNALNGLFLRVTSDVDITKITADKNLQDGVNGYSALGNINITCGSMTENLNYGWKLQIGTAGKLLVLKGVFALGNTVGNTLQTGGTLVTTRTCPLP